MKSSYKRIRELETIIREQETALSEYHILVATLAANLPEFEGCERPLKKDDGFLIKKRMMELERFCEHAGIMLENKTK